MTKRNQTSTLRCSAFLLFALGLFAAAGKAQEPRLDELPDGPAPVPLVEGARWLQQALLLPLLKRPPVPPKEQLAPDVQEVAGVQERIGSVVKGSFFEVNPADKAEQQRYLAELMKQQRATAAPTTQRVSDEPSSEFSSMPVLNPYQQSIDPTQAAVEQLRASARNIDLAAANLEDAGQYEAADRLRSTAQRLRREAREFAAVKEVPAQSAAITR